MVGTSGEAARQRYGDHALSRQEAAIRDEDIANALRRVAQKVTALRKAGSRLAKESRSTVIEGSSLPFVGFDESGDMVALVASGVPLWPENSDLSAIADDQLAAMEALFWKEFDRMFTLAEAQLAAVSVVVERVHSLHREAAARVAVAASRGEVPETVPTPDEEAVKRYF
jgi:uncharacterized protein YqgV (UPF0045/DUF77 family)